MLEFSIEQSSRVRYNFIFLSRALDSGYFKAYKVYITHAPYGAIEFSDVTSPFRRIQILRNNTEGSFTSQGLKVIYIGIVNVSTCGARLLRLLLRTGALIIEREIWLGMTLSSRARAEKHNARQHESDKEIGQ